MSAVLAGISGHSGFDLSELLRESLGESEGVVLEGGVDVVDPGRPPLMNEM